MNDHKLSTQSKIIILTAVLASLLEIIDTSIVNVAIPTMMGNLGATLENISWVVTGYIIANAIVLPIAGWMGVQIGRRKYYVGCILLFTGTSVLCGLAPNLPVLIVFRIIQGFAGGALLPTSQALIQEQFPREKAGVASAIYGMSVMIGPTLGPTLGGYLTDNFGWRSIFNINLPLGLFAAFMAYLNVTDIQTGNTGLRKSKVDLIGLGLLSVSIGCLQYVLERGQADEWFDSKVILTCSILAALAIPAFIYWELRVPHPVVDLKLFKETPVLRSGSLLMMGVGCVLYGLVFILPIFVSVMFGYTATQTGILFIPGALITAMCMPFVGAQTRKRDPRLLIFVGILITECSIMMMTQFNALSSEGDLLVPLLVRGLGLAFLFVPINGAVLSQFSGAALGQAAGILNLSRQVGGSIGIAVLSVLLDRRNAENYLRLVEHVSLLERNTVEAIRGSAHAMSNSMESFVGLTNATQAALKALSFRVQKQVFALSVQQLLFTLVIIFGLALIPLVFLKGDKKPTGPIDAH